MAIKEKIKMDDYESWGLNVSGTVGIGGDNLPGDVLMIKAMFHYLAKRDYAKYDRFWVLGIRSMSQLPEVNVKFDSKLARVIINYQKTYDYLILSVDGVIHPASNQNRNIKFASKENSRLMTITLLHTDLMGATATGDDYTAEILRDFPDLGVWL